MAKIALQELYKRALEHKGYREVFNSRSHRYTEMRHPDHKNAIYLGSAGGVRVGPRASYTAAMSDQAKAALLGELAQHLRTVVLGPERQETPDAS